MTDRMIEKWSSLLYWDDGSEELWSRFKNEFVQKPEAVRLADLNVINQWADQEDRPTREAASLLTKQREVESIHRRLKAAGR